MTRAAWWWARKDYIAEFAPPALPPDVINPGNQAYYVGQTIDPLVINNVGGAANSWTATPLPDGLSITNETPTQITIGGRVEGPADAAPILHDPGDQTVQVGVPFNLTIYNTGGPVEPGGWDVRTDWLPDGLTYDDSDPYQLVISGIPTEPEAPYVQTPKRSIPVRGDRINLANPLARGLVGYWPMLEGTGETVADYSGNNNHGAMQNMDPATDWVAGKHGKALDFDGVDDYIDTGTVFGAGWQDFTVLAAVRPSASGNYDGLVCFSRNSNNRNFEWYYHSADTCVLFLNGDGLNLWDCNYSTTVGEESMLVVTRRGSSVTAYQDGQATNSTTYGESLQTPDRNTYIGGGHLGDFPGQISQVSIFNRALSPHEVSTLYADPWALFR